MAFSGSQISRLAPGAFPRSWPGGFTAKEPPAFELVYRTGAAQVQQLADLDAFMAAAIGGIAALEADIDSWMDWEMGFAESVYIGATELAGIFDDDSTDGGERIGPRALMKTSDIVTNSIDQGSALTIRSRTFYVRGVQRDGTGISRVILEE